MSKEIKEKCKECVYYNEKQQYPDVEGATTHLNCLSLKCQYRKVTKDVKIARLENKIYDLEAKLAEKEKKYKESVEKILSSRDKFVLEYTQDKVSFAVEQLTEIREYVKECWGLDELEGKVRLDIAKKIRLKIEELTHQHEDKGE